MTGNNITLRQRKKALTRQKVLAAARDLFTERDYHSVTIRELAKAFGMSTGALFNNFSGKADLFEAAMGFPPPVDGPLTRAAPMLLEALVKVTLSTEWSCMETETQEAVDQALSLATYPLDGKVWARHLEAIRRDDPHTLAAGEADPLASSGGSAA